jgi:hypothetical protein
VDEVTWQSVALINFPASEKTARRIYPPKRAPLVDSPREAARDQLTRSDHLPQAAQLRLNLNASGQIALKTSLQLSNFTGFYFFSILLPFVESINFKEEYKWQMSW